MLSLDSGGAKGWSQLSIIHDMICNIRQEFQEDLTEDLHLSESDTYPCEYFVSGSPPLHHLLTLDDRISS